MIARRLGRSVVLLERAKHPRFAMGESSTPLTNLLLEELATRYDLASIKPLAKWGTWQRAYPEVACGLKRGFTFYHHTLGTDAGAERDRSKELLIAASPHDSIADTHWYRADFDQFLVREAQRAGADYFDEIALHAVTETSDYVELKGTRSGADLEVRSKLVVDASGPRGFLHRMLRLPEDPLPGLPRTQALYSHFSGVGRFADQHVDSSGEVPPYPVDDAAVHHVFDGGWIWVLQFNNGVTSAGVAATDATAERLLLFDGAEAWQRLLRLIPRLGEQFKAARVERPFTYVPRLAFRSAKASGKRWILLPSAAGFVDPLLSTGFALTLLGVARLAEVIKDDWGSESMAASLAAVACKCDRELAAAGRLVGSLYASMSDFPLFASLSLLYFAAAIYSETARRLDKPELAASFLLHDHPTFGPRCRDLFDRIQNSPLPFDSTQIQAEIQAIIEPLNLAGLGDPRRRNWYPVVAQDLYDSAWKVGATHRQISDLLDRVGFAAPLSPSLV